jgi:hypothetical protein
MGQISEILLQRGITMAQFSSANELKTACRYCATISRAKFEKFFQRQFIPEPTDDTATVTFIKLEQRTYAVTAGHVVQQFEQQAVRDGIAPTCYFVP